MLTDALSKLLQSSGFTALNWQYIVMIAISLVLIYLAIVKKFEPLLLLPIAFGILLANLPLSDLMNGPAVRLFSLIVETAEHANKHKKAAR